MQTTSEKIIDEKKNMYVDLETGNTLHLADIIGQKLELNLRMGADDLGQSLNRMNSKFLELTAKTMSDENCKDTEDFMVGMCYFLNDLGDVSIHFEKLSKDGK